MLKERESLKITCQTCYHKNLCLPRKLPEEEVQDLNKFITKIHILEKGEHIYRQEEKAVALYAINTGVCKEYWIDEEGNEHVSNFYFPGDILAFEAMPTQKHIASACAMTNAKVCVIPVDSLRQKMATSPALLKRVMDIMAYKMRNDRQVYFVSNSKKRVASFLLNILYRLEERNFTPNHILLPMSQLDIGNLLGMAFETVNRILHEFQTKQIISISNKEVIITQRQKLEEIANAAKILGQV
jgi:CRP/FNR family transcriptional regulator